MSRERDVSTAAIRDAEVTGQMLLGNICGNNVSHLVTIWSGLVARITAIMRSPMLPIA